MVNNNKPYMCYYNLTHIKGNIIVESIFPREVVDEKRKIPFFQTLGNYLEDIEKITSFFKDAEEILPKGKRYFNFSSIRRQGSSVEIIPRKKLEELCEILNKGKEEEIYKIVRRRNFQTSKKYKIQ